jgi:hypothetical protein
MVSNSSGDGVPAPPRQTSITFLFSRTVSVGIFGRSLKVTVRTRTSMHWLISTKAAQLG